jgi:hypothetical protein
MVSANSESPSEITGKGNIVTSALKVDTVYFVETLVSTYECMWCENPPKHCHPYHLENIRYYNYFTE